MRGKRGRSEEEMKGEEDGDEENGADERRGMKKGGREGGEMRKGEIEMVRRLMRTLRVGWKSGEGPEEE